MSIMTTMRLTPFKGVPVHINQSECDNNELAFDKILSRVAEVRSGWSEEERATRRRIGEARRQQLITLVQNKAA